MPRIIAQTRGESIINDLPTLPGGVLRAPLYSGSIQHTLRYGLRRRAWMYRETSPSGIPYKRTTCERECVHTYHLRLLVVRQVIVSGVEALHVIQLSS